VGELVSTGENRLGKKKRRCGDRKNDEEWEGTEGRDIRPDVGSVHGTVHWVSVRDGVSHATNGELVCVASSITSFRSSPLKSDPQESNPPLRRPFNPPEESTAAIHIFRGPKPPVNIGSM
jgi:hypothetical protein